MKWCWLLLDHARDRILVMRCLPRRECASAEALGLRHADFVSRAKQIRDPAPRGQRQWCPRKPVALGGADPSDCEPGPEAIRIICTPSTAEIDSRLRVREPCGRGRDQRLLMTLFGGALTWSARPGPAPGWSLALHAAPHSRHRVGAPGMHIEVVALGCLRTARRLPPARPMCISMSVKISAPAPVGGDMGRKSSNARDLFVLPATPGSCGRPSPAAAARSKLSTPQDIDRHAARLGIRARRGQRDGPLRGD